MNESHHDKLTVMTVMSQLCDKLTDSPINYQNFS